MATSILNFIHLSDTHLYALQNPELSPTPDPLARAQTVINHVNAQIFPVDFVLHTGDVGNDFTAPEQYRQTHDFLKQLRSPLHVIPGNHDQRDWLREVFYPHSPTTYYRFEKNGVEIVCMDTSVPNQPHGNIDPTQLAWLNAICAPPSTKPLIVALHHHLFPVGSPPMDAMTVKNGMSVHQILMKASNRLRCVLFGHVHERLTFVRDGILYTTAPSTWFQLRTWHGQANMFWMDKEALPGYNVVTLADDGMVTIRHVSVAPHD